MMSSRLIRPTVVSRRAYPVYVPTALDRGVGGEAKPGGPEAAANREEDAVRALEELQGRWNEREEEFRRTLAAARAEAALPVKEIVERFTAMIDDFRAQQKELVRSSEETVVRIAALMARKIVGDAIRIDEEIVLETTRNALKQVVEKESVIIRVHPQDLKIVRDHGSEWLGLLEGSRSMEIVDDERVGRGGCLVETEAGNVEAQIEKQLKTLERVLVEKVQ